MRTYLLSRGDIQHLRQNNPFNVTSVTWNLPWLHVTCDLENQLITFTPLMDCYYDCIIMFNAHAALVCIYADLNVPLLYINYFYNMLYILLAAAEFGYCVLCCVYVILSMHILAVVFMATGGKMMLSIANIHIPLNFHSALSYVDIFPCFE